MATKSPREYAESFAKLLRVPTITNSDRANFARFREVLKEQFPNVFGNCELIFPGGDKSDAIILKWTGRSSARPIVLMAHQDVVPATGGDWKYEPFSGVIADDKVWGRGAMDCKNTLFCTLSSVEELIAEGFKPEHDVYLSYSDNEETSGPGAEYARDWFIEKGIRPVLVVDEGGAVVEQAFPGMTKPFGMIGIIEKGYCDLKFTARGKGGHSSAPPQNTPMARLAAFVNYCETHTVFKPEMTAPAKQMLRGLSDGLSGPLKFITRHVGAFSPLIVALLPKLTPFGKALLGTTITFTMSGASDAPNVIPQEAYVVANLRFAPGDKSADCIEKVRGIAERYDLETEVLIAREHSPVVDVNTAEYRYFADTLKRVFPDIGVSPYLMFGGTDCRRMQEIIPCALRCTPCRLSQSQLNAMHASNENIDVASLAECTLFFKEFIKGFK